jgi:hypothetical protein
MDGLYAEALSSRGSNAVWEAPHVSRRRTALLAKGAAQGWLICERDLRLGRIIGAGTFGQTYEAGWHGVKVLSRFSVKLSRGLSSVVVRFMHKTCFCVRNRLTLCIAASRCSHSNATRADTSIILRHCGACVVFQRRRCMRLLYRRNVLHACATLAIGCADLPHIPRRMLAGSQIWKVRVSAQCLLQGF